MNNELIPFDFEGRQVRVVTDAQGEPWFVAADVCAALHLPDTHKAVARLDDDEKGRNSIPTLGGDQEMTVVNEPGLSAKATNQRLARHGLQFRNERDEWELTESGEAWAEAMPYSRNGHSGYQILWNPAIAEQLKEVA